MRAPPLWYPADPLVALIAGRGWAEARVMSELGIDAHTLFDLRQEGRTIHYVVADRYASRLGLHPVLLWPSWFSDVADLSSEHWGALAAWRRYRARRGRSTAEAAPTTRRAAA